MRPFFGSRRNLRRFAGSRRTYASKSFNSGVAEVTEVYFSQGSPETAVIATTNDFIVPKTEYWQIDLNSSSTISAGDYISFGTPDGTFAVYFIMDEAGSPPSVASTEVAAAIFSGDTPEMVANAVYAALSSLESSYFYATQNSATIIIENTVAGPCTSAYALGGVGTITYLRTGETGQTDLGGFYFFGPEAGFYVWFDIVPGGAPDPGSQGGATNGVPVTLSQNFTNSDLCSHISASLQGEMAGIATVYPSGTNLMFSANINGNATDAGNYGTATHTNVTSVTNGTLTDAYPNQAYVTYNAPTPQEFYFYIYRNGAGSDPYLGGGIAVPFSDSDTADQIAGNVAGATNGIDGFDVVANGNKITMTSQVVGPCIDAASNDPIMSVNVVTQGSSPVNTTLERVTVSSHSFITGVSVRLTTTGTLPAPLAINTTYYLIKVDANTLKFATSLANANGGTAINLTTIGSGTHTIRQF